MTEEIVTSVHEAGHSGFPLGRLLFQHWRIGIVVMGIVSIGVAGWALSKPKIYEATTTLEYDPDPARPLGRSVDEVSRRNSDYWSNREWYETQNRILLSHEVAKDVVLDLGLHLGPDALWTPQEASTRSPLAATVETLLASTEVEQIPDTRLVQVTYRDTDPERARTVVDALAQSYLRRSAEERLRSTKQALNWLGNQLQELRGRLREAELKLHTFKEENDVLSVSLEDKQNIISTEIERFSVALMDARRRRIEMMAHLAEVRKATKDPMLVHEKLVGADSSVQNIREAYLAASANRANLVAKYGNKHPDVVALDNTLRERRKQMKERVAAIVLSAEAELGEAQRVERGLKTALEEAHVAGHELNRKEIEYRALRRERENTEKLHSLLLERTTQTDLVQALRLAYARVVDQAVAPETPVAPRLGLSLAIALLLGIVAGVAAVVLRTVLDTTVHVNQVELYGLNVLGIIPRIDQQRSGRRVVGSAANGDTGRDLYVHRHPRSSVAESWRAIRTNLTFLSAEKDVQTLLVTSASPQEGKTTTAVSIATTMAQAGRRVVLVDADLRRPRAHQTFGAHRDPGLTSLLLDISTGDDLLSAIKRTEVEGLDLLSAGPIPPNPAELLQTPQFKQVIAQLRENYDLVVIDSPPIAAVTDAAVIGAQVDGIVIVVRAQKTRHSALHWTMRQLRGLDTRVLGCVCNDADLAGARYGYGAGYYSQYYGSAGGGEAAPPDDPDDQGTNRPRPHGAPQGAV